MKGENKKETFLKENKISRLNLTAPEKTNFYFNFIVVMELLGFHLTYRLFSLFLSRFSFQDVDLFAWSHFNENDANNFTTSKWTFYAAATSQLNCSTGYNLENVQRRGGKSIVDVSA